jgi:hypothetical protein
MLLNLSETGMTDDGLAYLKDLHALRSLNLILQRYPLVPGMQQRRVLTDSPRALKNSKGSGVMTPFPGAPRFRRVRNATLWKLKR